MDIFLIAPFTVNIYHLHYNVFERGGEAISGNFAVSAEIALYPRSNIFEIYCNTCNTNENKLTVKRPIAPNNNAQ